MAFFDEIGIDDIPDSGSFGSAPTPRSIWVEEMLKEFLNSKAKAAKISKNMDGVPFASTKEATSYCSSIASKLKQKKFKGKFTCVQRGRSLYLSKVRILKLGEGNE